MPKITFTRENRVVEVEPGTVLRDAAMAEGIQVYPGIKRIFNCKGNGLCGECRVYVTKGMENTSPKTFIEKARIAMSYFKIGHEDEVRLSCRMKVLGDIEVYTQPQFNMFGERKKRAAAAHE